jgi:serine/threonine protein phosphatase 1
MLAKLLSRRSRSSAPAARVPEGRRIYAVGDVHGRLDLLKPLLERVIDDDRRRQGPTGELLFLGDLIDRGPQSAQVIDTLIALRESRPSTRFLIGNHEEVFLQVLGGDAKALRFFTRMGGRETILSYGISPADYTAADYDELAQLFLAAVPSAHQEFVQSFENMIVEGDYAFVHAGIRPGVALAEQRAADLRWIRGDFLSARPPFEKVVVHGHTVSEEVVDLPHRIGLDTGAHRTGTLTAMGFEGGERWIVQACDAVLAPAF